MCRSIDAEGGKCLRAVWLRVLKKGHPKCLDGLLKELFISN
jgi:hypothetical protein